MSLTNTCIENWLRSYMSNPEKNTMKALPGFAFDLPSVGFSRADDPLYAFYQQHIDPDFYLRPEQWLETVFHHPFDAANVSVISWVLPQTEDTRAKSRASTDCPTMEWQMVRVHGEECNRSSDFFEEHIRNYEYEAILALGFEALRYADTVLINAPFTREIRDPEYIKGLRAQLAEYDAKLCAIWIVTDVEVCKARMMKRNSDRDTWKMAHWDEYVKRINFNIPEDLYLEGQPDSLLLYYNSNDDLADASFARILPILNGD